MNAGGRTLRQRIDEVEARVAQRQERLQFCWRDTQRATRAAMRVNTLPLVATGAAVVLGYFLLRRPRQTVKAGGLTGVLVAAGLALLRLRYGALYSLAWHLASRRRSPPPRRGLS
jgi:hypothetical protein